MNRIVMFAVVTLYSTASFCQTKLIAHISHGGKNSNFSIYNSNGNFGIDPRPRKKIDSAELKRQDSIRRSKELPITLIKSPAKRIAAIALAKK